MTTFEEQLKEALAATYDIERELGGGGMSRVFVATDKSLGRKVVIKVLSPELTAEVNRGRFRREIQVAAQLQHPHIVTLLSAGEYGELVYYTMPFIKGESLKSALEKNGPLAVTEVVRILYDVVDALAYAHENGVVHRDIKPANILRSGAHFLVTDFGVAKALNAAMQTGQMTSTGMAVGTPSYMAPEQLAGDPSADHRIDIYAVGLLAYELLAGKSPFWAPSPKGILAAVLTREPRPLFEVRPDVPGSLSEMVMSCLSKEPEGRPDSALEMLAGLDMFSTASGEIRTREHRVPKTPSTPVMNPVFSAEIPAVSTASGISEVSGVSGVMGRSGVAPASTGDLHVPSREQPAVVAANAVTGDVPTYEPHRTRKSSTKVLVGTVALLVPIAAAAFWMSQRSDETPAVGSSPPVAAAIVDSVPQAQAQPDSAVPVQPPVAAPVVVDSQAIKDSLRKRAQAAKLAAARADSLRQKAAQNTTKVATPVDNRVVAARRAAANLLADPNARAAFMRGATRRGGPLGTRRKGDLQTQIDALQPFLSSAGLTYNEFKQIVQESGFTIFDQFGRIEPGALARFSNGN